MTWGNPPKLEPTKPKHELMTEHFILIDRGEAIRQNLTMYFTGNPCVYGHIDYIYVSSGSCRTCSRLSSREAGRRNMKRVVDRHNLRVYGKEPHEIEAMIKDQNNKCMLCEEEFIKTPHLDHNHKTGKVRAMLCHHCNTGLGLFKDDIAKLQKGIDYLRKYDGLEKSSEICSLPSESREENNSGKFSSKWE